MVSSNDFLCDIRLIVFDLDGTLIDSREDLALSVNAMRQQMGLGLLAYDVITSYVGHGVTNLVRRALANGASGGLSAEAIEQGTRLFLDYYWEHKLDRTVAYPGVVEALAELDRRRMAVLTNKPVRFSTAILEGLGIARHFEFIYGGNSFESKKPDPEGLLKIMKDTGSAPGQTLMVGDSDTDVLTGRNGHVWTCGVTYGLAPETLVVTPPDVLLADLRDLPPLLEAGKSAPQDPHPTPWKPEASKEL